MAAYSDEQADGFSSTRRKSQSGKRVPRASRSAMQLPPRDGQPLMPSPARSAVSFRSLAAQPSVGSPPDGSFWRLLPVSEGSRRNSAAAAGPAPSWVASTPESVETVKRSPLTPFPPLASAEADGAQAEEHQGRVPDPVRRARRSVGRRWALSTAVHGAVLFGQCVVTLAVFSVFVAATVWKKGSTPSAFWHMLWNYAVPALGLVFALCSGTLVLHEARVLSTVAVLRLEALILAATTATALGLWIWVLTQDAGQLVKGVVVGCVAMMMGTGTLAFTRAALAWWLEDCGKTGGGGGGGGDDAGYEVLQDSLGSPA